jgi:hypothetical protein
MDLTQTSKIENPLRHFSITLGLGLLMMILITVSPIALVRAPTSGSFAFAISGLAGNAGITCPNSNGNCYNHAAEPAIRADGAGRFYGSSENGLTGGTDAWRSTDGGLHYLSLVSPNSRSAASNQFSPAGGDTDIAVASQPNLNGLYNVYVASLALTNVYVSTSKDGGNTWSLNPTGASVPGDDRPWIAADGSSKVCVSYHSITATNDIFVTCSNDAGLTFAQTGNAFDANHLWLAGFQNAIGNLAIDPGNHYIYQSLSGPAAATDTTCTNCGLHAVWLAVSSDGGLTFTDHAVYINPSTSVSYGHQFVNISVDKAGNIYAIFTDDHNLYYSFSIDHGITWSPPVQINKTPSNTAIFPWSTAGGAGKLDIVWYGTSYYDGTNPPDNYPMSAAWYVYFAQNLQATTTPSNFTQVAATPIIHYGGVCEGGVGCTGNRDLYDDFGVAASPTTGLASIIYSDDQYVNTSTEPAAPGCTSAATNTGSCGHTNVATQTSGPGIFP